MKILHIYKDYAPVRGGIENHVQVLAEAQAAAGHDVSVLVCARGLRPDARLQGGVRLVLAGRLATVASMPLSVDFWPRLLRLSADITHLHAPFPLGEVGQWLCGRGRRYVVSYHADVTRPVQRAIMRLYGPLFRHILRRAARILPTSPGYAASSPVLRTLGDRCTVVPLGVAAATFVPAAAPPPGPPQLLFVGAMRHYKGLDTLLQALTLLPPDVHLTLAGMGPLRAPSERLAARLGLRARVRFLGPVADADLPALYRAAHAFVLPANSRAEAFGTVLLEAMASGLPCVTTDVGAGTSWVVQHERTGLVVPPRHPQALAAALRRLLADPDHARHFGAAGRARVLAHFTEERMVAAIEAVYREVLGAADPPAGREPGPPGPSPR